MIFFFKKSKHCKMDGWIKLHRKLLEDTLWTCEVFTRGQAWVDLILLANHDTSFFYKRGVKIEVLRGQVGRSEVELADRWRWSRTKVRTFLNDLKREQQIEQQKTNLTQILTIINYDEYQKKEQQTGQQKNSRKTPEEQQKNTYKNVKNDKNEKNIVSKDILSKIQKEFYDTIAPFVSIYKKEMLRQFYEYWSEPNKSGTKIRYQLQKTWDLNLRLKNWAAKEPFMSKSKIIESGPEIKIVDKW